MAGVIGILGKKVRMAQIVGLTKANETKLLPVTAVSIEDNIVVRIKDEKKDGYVACQLAFGDCSEKRINRPLRCYLNSLNIENKRYLREIRNMNGLDVGSTVSLSLFKTGSRVKVSAVSRGKGTAGVTKRYHFKVGPMSHGASPPHRLIGPMGGGRGSKSLTGISPGKKMPGRMGNAKVTCISVIEKIDEDKKLIFLRGPVPGPKNGLVTIQTKKE